MVHKKILELSGIESHIQVCESGQDALDYLNCEGDFISEPSFPQPGIVFLDINMPGMNGWEFLDNYEKLPDDRKARIVVAMLTTSTNPDDKECAESRESVMTFFSKPLKKDYLLQIINENFS